jgi:LacI family transcriptional regulator
VKKKGSPKPSLNDIAKAAGVSRTAVSYALRNYPSVSKETRERVQAIAKKLGYAPDARIVAWMAKMQQAKSKDLLPIAWLNSDAHEEDAWRKHAFLTPFLEGARERCQSLGYRIEEFWLRKPKQTMQRLSQILYQRGIEGAIITYPATHVRLKWDYLAGVSLGGALLAPRLHRVTTDYYFNMKMALKVLKRYGYRRIGLFLSAEGLRFSHRLDETIAYHFVATTPPADRVPTLTYTNKDEVTGQKNLVAWVKRHRPEVIVCANNHVVSWVEAMGLRVPQDIGVIHLSLDDDVLDWAGIHSHKRTMGAAAAEWVISMIHNHQFGVPEASMSMLVRGTWQTGKTLLTPRAV